MCLTHALSRVAHMHLAQDFADPIRKWAEIPHSEYFYMRGSDAVVSCEKRFLDKRCETMGKKKTVDMSETRGELKVCKRIVRSANPPYGTRTLHFSRLPLNA